MSVSNDGDFIKGTDGVVMARVPVNLSYFDLQEYGLERFNKMKDDQVVKEPTLLHVFLRTLEQHCALRTLTPSDMSSNIIDVTGSPGSMYMYMKHFWNHDENLMCFVDHVYPLQSPGIGDTADNILVEDGAEIDLGMFTDWTFWGDGAFTQFSITSANIDTDDEISLCMLGTATSAVNNGTQGAVAPMPGEKVRISKNAGKTWVFQIATTDASGNITLRFNNPGTYYLSGGPKFKNYRNAAPPISVITVNGDKVNDGIVRVTFNSPGGTPVPAQDVQQFGRVVKPADHKRKGYIFAGWYTDAACKHRFDFKSGVSEDIILYAKWKKGYYKRENQGRQSGENQKFEC